MKQHILRYFSRKNFAHISLFSAFSLRRFYQVVCFYARFATIFAPLSLFARFSQAKRALVYVVFLSLFVLIPIGLHAKEFINTVNVLDTLKYGEITNAKIISTQDSGIAGFSFIVIQKDGFQIPFLASSDGKTLMILSSEALITKNTAFKNNLESINKKVQEFNEKAREDAVLSVFQKYRDIVLKLEANNAKNPKKHTTYIVLDTNCPYCKQELQNIDKHLANGDLYILIAGALSLESTKKAATFYAHLNEQKSKAEKIAYLKKAFEASYKPESNINANKAMNISQELGAAGLQGVPYIIKR